MVTGELDPYNALNAINALYPDTTSGGLYHFYDTFNSMARTLTYQYDHDRLIAKYGWDAIWADNTEPQSYPEGVNVHAATTALGKGAFYINAYPLEHNRGIYEGWRSMGPNNKRVYILTRSAFAGQQRYAAGAWSGDINATASVLAAQIPAVSATPSPGCRTGPPTSAATLERRARSSSPAGSSSAPSARRSVFTARRRRSCTARSGARRARPTCWPSTTCATG